MLEKKQNSELMSNDKKNDILLIEDSQSLSLLYRKYLEEENHQVSHYDSGKDALNYLAKSIPNLVLLDLNLPDMDGMEILKYIHEKQLPCPVVIITAHGSVDKAVDAMRYGAFDFLEKPFKAARLLVTVRNALERYQLNDEIERYRDEFSRQTFHGFIGASLSMQSVYRIIESAAPSKATVFITGESGTGKEVCAEAIHLQSARKDHPFIALNCAAIPHDLMESEIFGHVKGAFTGASTERKGAALQAEGGTLFLDEICEMDLDLQTKFLRFIQTGSFQKVGGSKLQSVDVRFVCATNRNPSEEVAAGRFREDLFYRLHVIPIHLPPLREREEDILLIANYFLKNYAQEENKSFNSFSPTCEMAFQNYQWPGNVRELQNVIRNIVVLNNGEEVVIEMLPPPLNSVDQVKQPSVRPTLVEKNEMDKHQIVPLWQVEKDAIHNAIALCSDNIPKAAALLQVSPSTIYRKLQSWEKLEK